MKLIIALQKQNAPASVDARANVFLFYIFTLRAL